MALVFFVSPALLYHGTNISCWIVFICMKCYFLRPFPQRTGSAFFFLFLFLDNSFLIDVYLVSVFVFQGVWLSVCLPAFLPIYLSDYRPTHALKMIFKKSWVLFLSPDESFCISLIDLEIEGERQQWIWDPLLIGNAFALGGVVRNSLMGLKFRALIQFYQYILLYVGT